MSASYEEDKEKPEVMKENFAALNIYLGEVESIVIGLLDPYISEKNKVKFSDTIKFLSSPEFLTKVWADERSRSELDKMCSSMKLYLEHPSRSPKKTN